jgi:predicted GNAT superfamily acetyltransferase
MKPRSKTIHIRACRSLDELGVCVKLHGEVWGLDDRDVIPHRLYVVATRVGGQVIGAFDTSREGADPEGDASSLIGFALALPGFAQDSGSPWQPSVVKAPLLASPVHAIHPYLHSHLLAVDPKYRNQGIGRRLKLFQREEALSRGIVRMEWTFDPLEIKNSYLNIHRLGVIVRRYAADLYGVSSSRLQGTLPTDRLYAEWWMESQRVKSAVEGKPVLSPAVEMSIVVPRAVADWKAGHGERERALEVQRKNHGLFKQGFARGLAVVGFRVDTEGNGIFQLGRIEASPEGLQATKLSGTAAAL